MHMTRFLAALAKFLNLALLAQGSSLQTENEIAMNMAGMPIGAENNGIIQTIPPPWVQTGLALISIVKIIGQFASQ
jgi:hypothetical protein